MIDKEGRLQRIDYGDRIYFDDVRGIAGTTYPIGTPDMPSDVIADVITICAARHLHKIDVEGALTLGATMEHYCFLGNEHQDIADTLDLNGQDVDGSHMEGLIVTGQQGGAAFLTLIRCTVNALTLFAGRMHYCSFYVSTSSFRDASFIDLIDCESISGVVTITVQAPTRASIKNWRGNLILTAQDGGLCNVRGFKGYLEIDLMTGGTLNIFADAADIQINGDCTGGTINIYGNARVTDNSAPGCTVNDYTKETQLDAIAAAIAAITGIDAYVEQIPDTDVNETVTDTEADCVLVDLAYVVGRTYCLRHLRLKCADPGIQTVTIRLYERWNDAIAQLIDSFDIDAANWGTYHSLMDMFSVPEIHSDAILIRAVHNGASPADDTAIEVTYRYAQANS